MELLSHFWPFVRGFHQWLVDFIHEGASHAGARNWVPSLHINWSAWLDLKIGHQDNSPSIGHQLNHYNDVIMSVMGSQITGVSIVCSSVGSGADQRKRQSSGSLDFVWGIDRWIPCTKGQWHWKCFHLMTSWWWLDFDRVIISFIVWDDKLLAEPIKTQFIGAHMYRFPQSNKYISWSTVP